MSQDVIIQIRLTIPDGVAYRVTTVPEPEPRSVLDEPLPTEPGNYDPVFAVAADVPFAAPVVRTMATAQPSGHSWMVGEVHAAGHKPLKAGNRGGVFCPQKLPDGSWCQFRA